MRFASLIDRFERLRARTAKRVEALSAASTGWRMNRKVGLTFGAIALAMVILGLVSVGSLAVIRSSVGGVTVNGTYIVLTVTDANTMTFTAAQTASASAGPTVCTVNATVYLATQLLARALPCERLLCATAIARLQVEGVLLDILDDIFLLHLPLEPAKRAFDGLAILHFHFSQA